LTDAGVVGPATWRKLYEVYKGITGNKPTPPANPDDYPGSPLRPGMSGSNVRLIQNYLNHIADVFPSIPKVTVDGVYGPATERAVMEYQRLFHLTVDGIVGPTTWRSIVQQYHLLFEDVYPGVALRVGSRGADVQTMQKYLNVIGTRYPSIPRLTEDGIFGNGTAAATREFQRIFGLASDGVIGPATWDAIVREYRKIATGDRSRQQEEVPPPPPSGVVEYAQSNAGNMTYPGKPLKKGDSGEHVSFLQHQLGSIAGAYNMLPLPDSGGTFGEDTEKAVKAFQQMVGLDADGEVGEQTWAAINDTYWNLTNRDAFISAMGRAIVAMNVLG